MKNCLRILLYVSLYLFFFSSLPFTACVKSVTDPPLPDSAYIINGLDVYVGGDSANWTKSTRNAFLFDSALNQLTQTITEADYGDPNFYTYHTAYQYNAANKLTGINFERDSYIYHSMHFEYSSSGDISKAFFTDRDGAVIENAFTTTTLNGNTVITQYDTLGSNQGKGEFFSNRPAVMQHTFNAAGKLINEYTIASERGQPVYRDTMETRYLYNENNQLQQTIHRAVTTDNSGSSNMVTSIDTLHFTRDHPALAPVSDLALAALGNLHWLTTCDYVNLFNGLASIQYGNVSPAEPLTSTYDAFPDRNYAASYQNTFDARGLLTKASITTTEHNIYSGGASTHETHYYTYLKIK